MPPTTKHGRIGGFETQSTQICYLIILLNIIVSCLMNFTEGWIWSFQRRDTAVLTALSNKNSICIFVDIKHNSV